MASEHDSSANMAEKTVPVAAPVDESHLHDLATTPVASGDKPGVKPVEKAPIVPKEDVSKEQPTASSKAYQEIPQDTPQEVPQETSQATSQEGTTKSQETPAPSTALPPQPSVVVNSPDNPVTEVPATPTKKPAAENPTTPQKDDKNNDTKLPLPLTSAQKRYQAAVDEIIEASTLCQEDLVKGLPSSFRPINRSEPIGLDLSEFSEIKTPTGPVKDDSNSPDSSSTSSSEQTTSPSSSDRSDSSSLPSEGDTPSPFQREYVLINVIKKLKEAWKLVLEKSGWQLGSALAVSTNFRPDVDAVRKAVAALQWRAATETTLEEVADAVELALLRQWSYCCRRTITRYWRDFHSDLVDEAREKAREVKKKVLADIAAIPDADSLSTTYYSTTSSSEEDEDESEPPTPTRKATTTPASKRSGLKAPVRKSASTTSTLRTPRPPARALPAVARNNKRQASSTADVLETQNRIARLNIHSDSQGATSSYALAPTSSGPIGNKKQRLAPAQNKPELVPVNPVQFSAEPQQMRRQVAPMRRRGGRGGGRGRGRGGATTDVVGHIGPYAVTSQGPSRSASRGPPVLEESTSAMDVDVEGDVFSSAG